MSITCAQINNRTSSASLFDCPTVEPDSEALRLVRTAHARARELGLTLPPWPSTTVEFVCVPDSAVGGQTRKYNGVVEMRFNIIPGQPLGEAFLRLCLHELFHVHQYATDDAWRSLEATEHEAELFAWSAVRGLRP